MNTSLNWLHTFSHEKRKGKKKRANYTFHKLDIYLFEHHRCVTVVQQKSVMPAYKFCDGLVYFEAIHKEFL